MNIEYLKYFAELAKIQHYGKAAKALNISQPGLSHAIKTLEEEYGVPLFEKEGRNVSLSHYGKELMTNAEDILDIYLRMEERAAGMRAEEKTVRIGTVYPLAAGMVPRMLKRIWFNISFCHLQPPDTGNFRRTSGWQIRYWFLFRSFKIQSIGILSRSSFLYCSSRSKGPSSCKKEMRFL